MKKPQIILLALFFALPGTALAADLVELTATCDSCHGPQGASSFSDMPTIGGQSAEYIADSLNSFQVWGRPCVKSLYRHGDTSRQKTDMCKIAGGLSGEDIAALSKHYSALPFVPAAQEFDNALAGTGAILHEENCETCHQQGGSSNTSRGPRLAGQWAAYLEHALEFVPTGEHQVPSVMERTLEKFSDEEIDALLNYYASQKGQ